MKNTGKHIPLLIVGIFTVGLVFGLYFYMYHVVNTSPLRIAEIDNTGLAVSVAENQDQNVASLYKKTSANRVELKGLFIPGNEAVSFIENLEKLGAKTGATVELSGVSSSDTSPSMPGSFTGLSADVNVSGSWPAVVRTIVLSENLPYQSTISGLKLNIERKGENSHSWRASYRISAAVLNGATSTKQ